MLRMIGCVARNCGTAVYVGPGAKLESEDLLIENCQNGIVNHGSAKIKRTRIINTIAKNNRGVIGVIGVVATAIVGGAGYALPYVDHGVALTQIWKWVHGQS